MIAMNIHSFSFRDIFLNKFRFELSDLGDLSTYSFTDLVQQLPSFQINIDNFQEHFIAKFESRNTVIKIMYCPEGGFMRIVDQGWR